jgi:catechol 2,3-dioxygenase-like lactoylglutathione lyase family enzyme
MSETPPGGVNLHCRDVGALFDLLVRVLEFTPHFIVRDPQGGGKFAGVSWGTIGVGQRLVLGDIHEALHGHYDHGEFGKEMEAHPLGTGVVFYFYVNDVDAYFRRILDRGATIDEPPTDQFWGDRTVSVVVPEGYYFTFAQPIPGFRFPERLAKATEWFGPPTGQ